MKTLRILLTPALLIAAIAIAQGPSSALTSETMAQTVQSLSKALSESYAYPETAKKAIAAMDSHLKANDYAAITDGKAFAAQLTKDLDAVCHDAHLRVFFSEEPLPERKKASEPSPEEIKRDQDRTRFVNAGFTKVERLEGNIGYISFRNFMDADQAKRPLKAAMEFLKDTDALIFDIRQNGGGSPETVQLICSYLFGETPVHLNDLVERDGTREEFWTLKKVDGPRYLNKDVYVLVSKRTGSAAEEFSYNLKNLKRATIVGEATWGGANPGSTVRLNDHFAIFVPHAHAENPITKTNWEGTGVYPDVAVDPKDALTVAYTMALRKQATAVSDPDVKQRIEELIKEQEGKKGQ